MRLLLSLDLSTTCTGYGVFDLENKKLFEYGFLSPKVKNPIKKGIPLHQYPKLQGLKIKDLVEQILDLISKYNPEIIAIEEVVSHKSRLTGKVLDGLHFVLVDRLLEFKGQIKYVDVSGTSGWRPRFNIRLSELDKLTNQERKKFNKKAQRKDQLPIIDWKTLSSRFVNARYGLALDPNKSSSDGDVADAIMVGTYVLEDLPA
jgi:hypothetical protein